MTGTQGKKNQDTGRTFTLAGITTMGPAISMIVPVMGTAMLRGDMPLQTSLTSRRCQRTSMIRPRSI